MSEDQTQGKGRLGRSWFSSPYVNLTFSLLLFPKRPPDEYPLFTLAAANAIVNTLQETCGIPARVKWPNDILIHGKKVAGILLDLVVLSSTQRAFILGIGINVNMTSDQFPPEMQKTASSLRIYSGSSVQREMFLSVLLNHLEKWYGLFQKGESELIQSEWKAASETLGRMVEVKLAQGTVKGLAKDLNAEGALVLEGEQGNEHIIHSGDVVHLRSGG